MTPPRPARLCVEVRFSAASLGFFRSTAVDTVWALANRAFRAGTNLAPERAVGRAPERRCRQRKLRRVLLPQHAMQAHRLRHALEQNVADQLELDAVRGRNLAGILDRKSVV